jgi:hypothetical protein
MVLEERQSCWSWEYLEAANSGEGGVEAADSSFSQGYSYSAAQHLNSRDAHIFGLLVLVPVFAVLESILSLTSCSSKCY